MSLVQSLLHLTDFKSPFLQTLAPTLALSYGIQAGVAIPSMLAQSERFYDFSGSLTFLSCTALSLYLPALRARYAAGGLASNMGSLPSLLAPFTAAGASGFNWRQVVLSGAVALWATRLGTYLFQRVLKEGKDSRFDAIKTSPPKFAAAFAAQATWVSLCLMPVIAVNAAPASALAAGLKPSDVLGLSLYAGGLLLEVVADRQKAEWMRERREKVHDEAFITRGLWSRSQYPHYFGETMLWTGIATAAAGIVVRQPARLALGLSAVTAASLCYVSPAFTAFVLLKVSGVPLSEKKYDARYGHRTDYQEWKRNTPRFFPRLF